MNEVHVPFARQHVSPPGFLAGSGAMGALMGAYDWSKTPLGPIDGWPQSLKTASTMVLRSPVPMVLLWGDDGIMIYNEAYSLFAGARHPQLLGSRVREGWPEVADFNDHVMKTGLAGDTLAYKDQELTLYRHGRPEQVWMNLDYSPVLDESGRPAGVLAVVIETTARVHAERARDAAEAQASGVLEGMAEGFVLLDRDFRVVAINAEGMRLETRPREAILGRTHWEAWPGSEESHLGRLYKRAMRERIPVNLEHHYVWSDGRDAWIEMRGYPSGDGLALFYRDVTDRKRAEELLRDTERRLNAVLENASVAIFLMDHRQHCAYMNAAAVELTGYSFAETQGRPLHDVIHHTRPDGSHFPLHECAIDRAFPENHNQQGEEVFVHKDGHFYPVAFTASPIRDDASQTIGTIVEVRDISREKASQAALAASEASFQAIANSIDQMIWSTRPDGYHDYYNDRWYEYTGVPYGSTDGEAWNGMFHPDDQEHAWEVWRRSLETGEPYRIEYRLRDRSGQYRWVLGRAQCMRDDEGRIIRWYGTCTDIHDLKLGEDRQAFLLALNDHLRSAADPATATMAAIEALGRHIGVPRAGYGDIDESGEVVRVERDWTRDGTVASLAGESRILDGFGPGLITELKAGRTLVVDDCTTDPRVGEAYAAGWESIGCRALVVVPLIRDGRFRAILYLHEPRPRRWTAGEIGLAEDVAERTWDAVERARVQDELLRANTLRGAVMEAVPGVVYAKDREGRMLTANRGTAELVGKALADIIGRTDLELLDDKVEAEAVMANDRRVMAQNRTETLEESVTAPDGARLIWLSTKAPLRDAEGTTVGLVGASVDITERKLVEERLEEESRTLETLNRTGAALVGELDLERLVQMVTDAGVELTGARFGAFFYNVLNNDGESYMLYTLSGVDRSHFDKFPMPRATAVFQPTFKGEGIIRSADILTDPRYGKSEPHRGMPKGHLPVRSYLAVPVTSRSGEVIGGLFFGHERPGVFTERHERLIAGLAGQAAIAVDNARLFQTTQRLNETLEARVVERTAERDRIWRLSQDLLGVADGEGRWVSVNPAWTRVLGWRDDEVVGRTSEWLEHPDDQANTRAEVTRLAAGAPTLGFENRLRHRDGHYRWLSWTAVPEEGLLYCVARDITAEKGRQAELEAAQEALRQSQKMEAVGQLTGGIAHDFNNMLAVVIGSLDLLGRRLGPDDARARRYVDAATDGARRAALLTQRLLAFSRQQPLKPEPIDANKLVGGMSDLLRHSLGSDIRLETVLSGGLWRTHADPNQLENVLLNLAVNARDAMPEGGRLTIETQNAHLDGRYAVTHLGVPSGQYVLIAVTDTGFGMAPEVIGKAFDPFFTTKEVGKGTGLGLSQVYGFVKQSGGHVKIYSEPGQGTTVKVYLPRYMASVDEVSGDSTAPAVPRGERQEVVLVVEDELAVRQFSIDALDELGYRVLEADGAAAALRMLDAHPEIALLFTDVVMPDINGRKLADEARRRRPDLKVLFTTGYTRNAVVHNGVLDPGVDLIGKPFTIEELAVKVRDVLEGPVAPAVG